MRPQKQSLSTPAWVILGLKKQPSSQANWDGMPTSASALEGGEDRCTTKQAVCLPFVQALEDEGVSMSTDTLPASCHSDKLCMGGQTRRSL